MAGARRQERAWVQGARAGSAADLEALFREHWPRAYRAAYLVVHDAAAARLSPEHRAVIVLRYLLEYTPGEIAELLELPRGTVNSRLRRGLDQLGGRLEEGDR